VEKQRLITSQPLRVLNYFLSFFKFFLFFFNFYLFIYLLFIYSHVHTLFGSFLLPAALTRPVPSSPPRFQAEPVLLLSLILWKRRHKHKEDSVFASWVKDSYTERFLELLSCTNVQVGSSLADLYTGSWSPSRVDLCQFKVSVLVPLEWGHQTLSCFGFSTYPHTSRMCSPLVMWPKSNHIAAFVLDLKSTYEGEHMIFGLLSLANFAQNDVS
jgi:hypothetical protein